MPFQPTGTNIVTNTAPTPGVRMRVVRTNGETANMVGLGEDLQLRIEIDQDSARKLNIFFGCAETFLSALSQ